MLTCSGHNVCGSTSPRQLRGLTTQEQERRTRWCVVKCAVWLGSAEQIAAADRAASTAFRVILPLLAARLLSFGVRGKVAVFDPILDAARYFMAKHRAKHIRGSIPDSVELGFGEAQLRGEREPAEEPAAAQYLAAAEAVRPAVNRVVFRAFVLRYCDIIDIPIAMKYLRRANDEATFERALREVVPTDGSPDGFLKGCIKFLAERKAIHELLEAHYKTTVGRDFLTNDGEYTADFRSWVKKSLRSAGCYYSHEAIYSWCVKNLAAKP